MPNQTVPQTTESKTQTEPGAARARFPSLHDPRYPVHRVASRLEPYLHAIVDRFQPEKIILFGSYASGQPTEHSDFDLLVIRRDMTSENASNLEIRRALWAVPGARPSFTILSKTPERVAERLTVGSPFYQDIIAHGLVVYAA
ncbi:MAG: nucleotidyltransferase domain-containing protein [Verrucomicrobia bacterium]|nr:nucleotidyltransferase domain-containing protein [Verrucomicrobiota bacterium]